MLASLGRVTTRLIALGHELEVLHDDVDAYFAPSECHQLVTHGWRRRVVEVFAEIQEETTYTWQELWQELVARTSDKWLYRSGASEVFTIMRELQDIAEERAARVRARHQSRLV